MALTAETIERLKGKGLDKFYLTHKDKLKRMVDAAEKFIRPWLPTGSKPHPGDLSGLVVILLRLDQDWVDRAEKPSALRGRSWANDFSEYMVDQIYPSSIK